MVWPHGQAVKTTPSHGVNPGSIPGEVIMLWILYPKHFYTIHKETGPVGRLMEDASVAQLVAQRIRNAWVAGSNPAGSLENKGFERRKSAQTLGLRIFYVFLWLLP